jgi:DNA polymerase-4
MESPEVAGTTAGATAATRSDATILHVDLDAFYASVEQHDDPTLAGRPVVVGGLGPRGVVAAASYEARAFGVFSATPMVRARRACPNGVFLAPRFGRYRGVSAEIMTILRSFTPLVEPIALDEAFLDVAGARRLHGDGPTIAATVRAQVREATGLTASVGVATTKLVAKLASDLSKPDGLLVVAPGTELDLLHPLPVRRLWGVGPATERKLAALGVRTIGDLAAAPEDAVVHALGNAAGHHLHELAWNRDGRPVVADQEVKSIGHEQTFPTDLHDHAELAHRLVGLADGVATRLRSAGVVARTVQLKVRFGDFTTVTRSRTLPGGTDLAADLLAVGRELLAALDVDPGVRLHGISGQQLVRTGAARSGAGAAAAAIEAGAAAEQTSLFAEASGEGDEAGEAGEATGTEPTAGGEVRDGPGDGPVEGGAHASPADPGRRAALERSVDAVRARFGPGAVGQGGARSLPEEGSDRPTR